MNTSITKKQLTTLALIGLLILILFAGSFVWFYSNVKGEEFLVFAPYWVFPYLGVISFYAGFFSARFAKGRGKNALLWGIIGFALTLIFMIGFPGLLSPIFPYQSPEIFAGPAIFAFIAPILSSLLIVLLISIRKKAIM